MKANGKTGRFAKRNSGLSEVTATKTEGYTLFNGLTTRATQLSAAVQIAPHDPEYLTNLATAFRAVGRIDDARRALKAALAAAPDYAPAREALQQIGPS